MGILKVDYHYSLNESLISTKICLSVNKHTLIVFIYQQSNSAFKNDPSTAAIQLLLKILQAQLNKLKKLLKVTEDKRIEYL